MQRGCFVILSAHTLAMAVPNFVTHRARMLVVVILMLVFAIQINASIVENVTNSCVPAGNSALGQRYVWEFYKI